MPDRVLWTEGLLVTPQHLQLWDELERQHVWALAQDSLWAKGGLFGVDPDAEALGAGRLSLRRVSAVFGDGTWVSAPEQDPLPEPRPAPPPGPERLGVLLARPVAAEAAFRPGERLVTDAYGEHLTREVQVGRPQLQLVLEGERLDGLEVLPVGELLARNNGGWEWSPRYIPPVLRVGASGALMSLLRDMRTLVVARSRRLMEQRQQGPPRELLYSDAVAMLTLSALHGLWAVLDQALDHPTTHPERLYATLRERIGAMCALGSGVSPQDLPGFRMNDLHATYAGLLEVLRRLLNTAEPVHVVPVPLRSNGPNYWLADLPQRVDWVRGRLLLTLAGSGLGQTNDKEILDSLKVAAASQVEEIALARLPGVRLRLLSAPPAGVPVRGGARCYDLESKGLFWDGMVREGALGLFVPNTLSSLNPELVFLP